MAAAEIIVFWLSPRPGTAPRAVARLAFNHESGSGVMERRGGPTRLISRAEAAHLLSSIQTRPNWCLVTDARSVAQAIAA